MKEFTFKKDLGGGMFVEVYCIAVEDDSVAVTSKFFGTLEDGTVVASDETFIDEIASVADKVEDEFMVKCVGEVAYETVDGVTMEFKVSVSDGKVVVDWKEVEK